MNAGNSNQHKYSNAGEQAGRVISEFISIAGDLSKRFEKEFSAKDGSCRRSPDNGPVNNNNSSDSASCTRVDKNYQNKDFRGDSEAADFENEWRKAGEYLRELREAAGYSVDGFAKAMNRQGAARKIQSVEEGRDIFPDDWLDQMSALLKQNDPMEFFEKLRGLYDVEPQVDVEGESYSAGAAADESSVTRSSAASSGVASQRRQKLQSVFSDEQLGNLSDSQFEELLSFVEVNFQSALQLVSSK